MKKIIVIYIKCKNNNNNMLIYNKMVSYFQIGY